MDEANNEKFRLQLPHGHPPPLSLTHTRIAQGSVALQSTARMNFLRRGPMTVQQSSREERKGRGGVRCEIYSQGGTIGLPIGRHRRERGGGGAIEACANFPSEDR